MPQPLRLGHAGALAGMLSVVAVSCGSDIIELLPPPADATSGGGGVDGAGGAAGHTPTISGTSSGGANATANTSGRGGMGGTPPADAGGAGSGSAGCYGFGCGDAGDNGLGGGFGGPICGNGNGNGPCTPCANDAQCPAEQHCSALLNNICTQCAIKGSSQCKVGYNCDVLIGRCSPGCVTNAECKNGRVCDPNQGTCVSCLENDECEQDGDPRTSICYARRCVECAQHSDCRQGERRFCSGFQCVE